MKADQLKLYVESQSVTSLAHCIATGMHIDSIVGAWRELGGNDRILLWFIETESCYIELVRTFSNCFYYYNKKHDIYYSFLFNDIALSISDTGLFFTCKELVSVFIQVRFIYWYVTRKQTLKPTETYKEDVIT